MGTDTQPLFLFCLAEWPSGSFKSLPRSVLPNIPLPDDCLEEPCHVVPLMRNLFRCFWKFICLNLSLSVQDEERRCVDNPQDVLCDEIQPVHSCLADFFFCLFFHRGLPIIYKLKRKKWFSSQTKSGRTISWESHVQPRLGSCSHM